MAIYSEFSHKKWWFSIVMLVYQRVKIMENKLIIVEIDYSGVPHFRKPSKFPSFLQLVQ